MYLGIPPRLHEDHVDGLNMVQIAGPLTMHFPDHELCKSVHPLDDCQNSSSSSTSRVPLVSWVVAVFLPTIVPDLGSRSLLPEG